MLDAMSENHGGKRPGAGRPRIAPHRLMVGLSTGDLERLDRYAAAHRRDIRRGITRPLNRSEALRKLVRDHARPGGSTVRPRSSGEPCPFCGRNKLAMVYGNGVEQLIECESCGALGPEAQGEAAARAAWNKRAGT